VYKENHGHLFKTNLASGRILDQPWYALGANWSTFMSRVEDELSQGEIIWDVGERAAG
jgi:hypothetical protein